MTTSLIDPTIADLNVRPQDDFFRHVNGTWLRTHEIPADRASDGAFHQLRDDSEIRSRELCEEVAAGKIQGADAEKIAALWGAFMDEGRIEELGASPLAGDIMAIRNASTHEELSTVMGRLQREGCGGLFSLWVGTDPHDSSATMLNLYQSGIGLPDEAYYREEQHAPIRDAYVVMLEKLLTLADAHEDPASAAKRILTLETAIAKNHRDAVSDRDPLSHDNPLKIGDLAKSFPGFPWAQYLQAIGINLPNETVINIGHPDHMREASALWASTPLDEWKEWLIAGLIDTRAPLLSSDLVNARFDFHGKVLSGTTELRPRWKRALGLVEGCMGEALGKLWVKRHFPADSKKQMDELIAALLEAYRESISALSWMGEETKEKALAKLATFNPKIGHPLKWHDYSALSFEGAQTLVDYVARSRAHSSDHELSKLGKPVDRDQWHMTPQTVNAYYNPTLNEIVFPAAILQSPFFSPDADAATNFGAIGAVIGHEIGHGFDDSGSRFDAHGNLENWWTDADREAFEKLTANLVNQYQGLTPRDLEKATTDLGEDTAGTRTDESNDATNTEATPDTVPTVNGELTLGENIGDLGGITIAWKACQAHLSAAGIDINEVGEDGFTHAQRFFQSWATVWRTKARPEFALQLLAVDPHSPAEFRCNQILKNVDAFVEAFNIQPGDDMWLNPESRVSIW